MLYIDGNSDLDQPVGRRETFVPLHTTDVVEYLSLHPDLPAEDRECFREVSSLILSLLHHIYRRRHEELTYVYAPLDPDRDKLLRTVPTSTTRDDLAEDVYDRTQDALQRANYHKLSPQDIQSALAAASKWGVRTRIRFSMLRHLEVHARGLVEGKREFRDWKKFFRKQTVTVPLYQRLVVVFRISDEAANDQFDPRRVYMRMFKNVPKQDIDMMLPSPGIQMSWFDHSKIVVPSVYAAAITMWKFLRNVVLLAFFGVFKTLAMLLLVLFAIGFGLKSMFTYRTNTQRRYMLNMTQSLYYQNLDNNAGVLFRLLEEGEQQEACEAILAFFVSSVIFKERKAATLEEIDAECERVLLEATDLQIDFDVERTARSLLRLGLLQLDENGWSALSVKDAARHLTWGNGFG